MLHSCEQTPRHAAAWGRGVQGIRQNFFAACARHAIQTRPSFRRRGVPRALGFNKSSFRGIQYRKLFPPTRPSARTGEGHGNFPMPCPRPQMGFGCVSCLLLPLMPMEACFLAGESVRKKAVGDVQASDCGLFCCQFAGCADVEKMYCWKALSATPVTSMPACSCASRIALVVLPPKMPSALSSR